MTKYGELFQTRSFLRDQREEAELQTRTYDRWILKRLGYRDYTQTHYCVDINTILLPQNNETRFRNNGEHLIEYWPGKPRTVSDLRELDCWSLEDCLLKIHPDLEIFSFSPSRPYLRILPLDLLDPDPRNKNWIRR